MGFWESDILGKSDLGKVIGKRDFGKVGFRESGILGKWYLGERDFGKLEF